MPFYPRVNETPTTRRVTDVFGGYNHKLKIADGEWFDMKNLTGAHYPLLANRDRRGTVTALDDPQGLIAKDALAWIDGKTVYYNGYPTELEVDAPTIHKQESEPSANNGEYWYVPSAGQTRLRLDGRWEDVAYPTKQLVSMGAYLCVFPDKVYLNTADLTDYGSMEARFEAPSDANVKYELTRLDGATISEATVSPEAPSEPQNGDYWIDNSEATRVLHQWSESMGQWTQIPTVYTRISCENIGVSFNQYDGVTLSGCELTDSTPIASQIKALNGSQVIYDKGDDYITIVGIVEGSATQVGGIVVERNVPQMDFVCEAGNRLWGCYYGLKNGEPVNELYCCVLGDFKNWQRYMGISTDAWAASVGSDGQWTGAVNYLGNPTFFKEDKVHMVSISAVGAHQVYEQSGQGVQKGSHRSMAIVGDTLFYLSRTGVFAYQGGMPVSVSSALGDVHYAEGTGGALGNDYYISMRDRDKWNLFTYDTRSGRWYRHDELQAIGFAEDDAELYAITPTALYAMTGRGGTLESAVAWEAVSGVLYYETIDRKYVSRYNIRLRMEKDAELDIYLQYDSNGEWVSSGHVKFAGLNTAMIPIRPRRCDHMRLKLAGKGEVRIFSIARILEEGSDQ